MAEPPGLLAQDDDLSLLLVHALRRDVGSQGLAPDAPMVQLMVGAEDKDLRGVVPAQRQFVDLLAESAPTVAAEAVLLDH